MSHSIETLSVAQPGGYRDVSPSDVVRAGYHGRVIDVREPAEFTGELGHLPRAELVPLSAENTRPGAVTAAASISTWMRALLASLAIEFMAEPAWV